MKGTWFFKICLIVLLVTTAEACKDPFEAELVSTQENVLVVEGFIHIGGGVTQIKLSRTTSLNQETGLIAENGASIVIENEAGTSYPLHFISNGVYESDSLGLETTTTYRLRIDAQEERYYSEYVTPLITPSIDSLNWTFKDKEVTIFANTHDPAEQTHFYKWDFEEVYEIESAVMTFYDYVNGEIIDRPTEDVVRMHWCWIYGQNSDLLIASSIRNSADEIRLFPITKIPLGSEKLAIRYSINAQQHILSAEEYDFLQIMKKNSQSLGTFFDSQPSEIKGNLYEASGNKMVIGFIGASTTAAKRIVIKNDELDNWEFEQLCDPPVFVSIDTSPGQIESTLRFNNIVSKSIVNFILTGFYVSPDYCTDCTSHAGAGPKPDFWVAEDLD